MTNFDDIYNNAKGHKEDLEQIVKMSKEIGVEKEKGEERVKWFRQRRGRIRKIVVPMKTELREKNQLKELKELRGIEQLILQTKKTKDIDQKKFEKGIERINQLQKKYSMSLDRFPDLPKTYDQKIIEKNYKDIKEVIKRVKKRYKMGLYKDAVDKLKTIQHDISNDRGTKAFNKRCRELKYSTNKGVKNFNEKYWQISGNRWERVGTNQWGYRKVKATHEKIDKIEIRIKRKG